MTGVPRRAFVMTDIVASTRLWADHTEAMASDLALHDQTVSAAIDQHAGTTISTAGDSFAATFVSADDAVHAAMAVQRDLAAVRWQVPTGIRVRIGVHVGAAQRRGDGWYGPPLNEAARIMASAHGGQIVVSEAVADRLSGIELIDLGAHRLRDLSGSRRLFQVSVPGLGKDFPPLRSMSGFVTTLPAQRTSLIGRDELIGRIRRMLLEHRLISLIGPGGAGKTRAAIEAAGRELVNFPDGVFFVDLTVAASPADVEAALVSGVRAAVPPDRSPEEHLAAYLSDRVALLVIDNCEHVVGRIGEMVDGFLDAAPDVRVLITSRMPLGVHGEQCVSVPSLAVDGPSSAAVRLFAERALAADDSTVIDDADLETVMEITQRLDGIPLAIELAAAQARTLTPVQILDHLGDRFRLLDGGPRQAPERQRTLEAAVDWSYRLLTEDEQVAFRRLSICAGAFTLPSAALMLELDLLDAAKALDSLVAKSLIMPLQFGPRLRGYRYLETLRDFGRHRLVEADELEAARASLEQALLPAPSLLRDWMSLANNYLWASDIVLVVEDATRRDAADRALRAGRLDAAALIFSSCAFRDDPGALETVLRLVSPLAGRRDELDPVAWRAVCTAKVALERSTRRYDACMATAIDMLEKLAPDDPARGWFELWRCALTTAVAPAVGIAEIDAVLPAVRVHAQPPHDWALSQLLSAKATGLAVLGRLEEALPMAREARTWAPVGKESLDQALASLLWLLYLSGEEVDEELLSEVAAQNQELGLAELCGAPGGLCVRGSIEDRAARLIALARRRPSTDLPTPFVLAFAWLAIEQGDHARAGDLLATVELYDSSTQIALIHALARVEGWTGETWNQGCDRAVGRYLSPAHEAESRKSAATLAAELERWERLLGPVRAGSTDS